MTKRHSMGHRIPTPKICISFQHTSYSYMSEGIACINDRFEPPALVQHVGIVPLDG